MTYTEWRKIYIEKSKTDSVILQRITRRKENTGAFAELKVPMQKRAITNICRKYGVDISFLNIKIQRNEELLNAFFVGSSDPRNIRRVDLMPKAFKSEEELLRTIIHEGAHVKQFIKYGSKYVQENQIYMEKVAYRYEDFFYKLVCKRIGK